MTIYHDTLSIAENLLHENTKVQSHSNLEYLDKVWISFGKETNENCNSHNNSDQKQHLTSHEQIKNCEKINSAWVLRETTLITKDFIIGDKIGSPGQYGIVKTATKISNNKTYAVKVINKHKFSEHKKRQCFFQDIRAEVYLLHKASEHPNVVECQMVYEDLANIYILMDACDGGELFDRIQSLEEDGFSEMQASRLFAQMVSAIYYIHSLGIVHCDLKPENFLFRDKSASSAISLIDFGMAKVVQWRKYYKRMNGTPYYIAPEVLAGHYNESCDMWSLGVILFIMVFGFPPFFDPEEETNQREKSDAIIYRKIQRGFNPKVLPDYGEWFPMAHPVSSSCRDIITRLLRRNVADRMTAEETLEHPWIKQQFQQKNTSLKRCLNPSIMHSLRNFRQHGKLQSEILNLLRECNYLNHGQIQSVKDFFSLTDINSDKQISIVELHQALKNSNPKITMEEAAEIFKSLDMDQNGFVTFDELLQSRINRKLQAKEERLIKVFNTLDLDKNGSICASELKAALNSVKKDNSISYEACMQLIDEADVDKDGEIDFEEFISIFRKGH